MNIQIKVHKARKNYRCDYSGHRIAIGQSYKRVNINYVGIFHFDLKVSNEKIKKHIGYQILKRDLDYLGDEFRYIDGSNDIFM